MKNRLLSFILIACLATTSLTAQVCGTYEGSYEEQKQKYPAFYQNLESLNADLAAKHKLALSKMTHLKAENGKKIIPVVVHVIHDGGGENITISQIQNGLDHLNKNINGQADNFLSITPDIFASVRGDLNVEFRLAKIDPLGKPTSGILRVRSELTDLPAPRDQVKALSYWSSHKYFNIWAVRSIPAIDSWTNPGGPNDPVYSPALNGYAQFPFNYYNNISDWISQGADGMSTDGVVIKAGELAAGRTLTHEV
jgi:hypothetical protein